MKPVTSLTPELRFPEFQTEWNQDIVDWYIKRVSSPVDVVSDQIYREIGVRSHGKGLFHKPEIQGKKLGGKRVFWIQPNAFIVNIVFAWEQAVALTTEREKGFIASHRFPMFIPRNNRIDLQFLLRFFLRKKGKNLLELASPGGAGRNKTLGQSEFSKLKIVAPRIEEQQKIAAFLTSVDEKLNKLRRKHELLETYKRSLMQKIFSLEIRFKQEDGSDFPDWEEKPLSSISDPVKRTTDNPNYPVMTISAGKGFLDQKERFNQVIAGSSLDKYTLIEKDEFAYNRGASKAYPYGCVYLMTEHKAALIPFVYRTFKLSSGVPNFFLQYFIGGFLDRQLRRLISSSARMDGLLNIGEKDFYSVKVPFPHVDEQEKIAAFLQGVDLKADMVAGKIKHLEVFKKALLQQMFV